MAEARNLLVTMIDGAHYGANLRIALKKLRVWESQWVDISYSAGDARAVIPDNEQPPEWIAMRSELAAEVTRLAALFCGELPEAAAMFADAHDSSGNPYNSDRVKLALAFYGWRVQIPNYEIAGGGENWRVMMAPLDSRRWYPAQVAEFGYRELAQAWIDERKPNKVQL